MANATTIANIDSLSASPVDRGRQSGAIVNRIEKAVRQVQNWWRTMLLFNPYFTPKRFYRFLSKIHLKYKYRSEPRSLEVGFRDREGKIAVYAFGYDCHRQLAPWLKINRWKKEAKRGHLNEADTEILRLKEQEEKFRRLKDLRIDLTHYFSDQKREEYRIQNVKNFDDLPLLDKSGGQNCLIISGGKIYAYPKIFPEYTLVGQNHSSLNSGRPVDFAGTIFRDGKFWVLCNHTGHYGTRASRLSICLIAFLSQNISLDKIIVQHRLPIYPSDPPSMEELANPKKETEKPGEAKVVVKKRPPRKWVKQTLENGSEFLVTSTPARKWVRDVFGASKITPEFVQWMKTTYRLGPEESSEGSTTQSDTDSSVSLREQKDAQEVERPLLGTPQVQVDTPCCCTIS